MSKKRLVIKHDRHCGKLKFSPPEFDGIMQVKSTNFNSNVCVYINKDEAKSIVEYLSDKFNF